MKWLVAKTLESEAASNEDDNAAAAATIDRPTNEDAFDEDDATVERPIKTNRRLFWTYYLLRNMLTVLLQSPKSGLARPAAPGARRLSCRHLLAREGIGYVGSYPP